MAEKRLIEMVCSGNSGRSTVAERLANWELEKRRLSEKYGATSSGVYVDIINSGKFTIPAMKPFFEFGKERAIYDAQELENLDAALKNEDTQKVAELFKSIIYIFGEEERANRTRALRELEIPGEVKTTPEQTIARPNTIAVLSMGGREQERVKAIYDGSRYNPTIEILSVFATGDPDAQLANSFGRGYEVYKAMIERMMEQIPRVVDKIISGED